MSDAEPPKKKSWGCLQWGAVMVVVVLGGSFFIPTFGVINDKANIAATSANARSIIMAMKLYAAENNGVYPESNHPEMVTSNALFRELFRANIVQDERIFGAKASKYIPDWNIGTAPDFDQAVAAGENHWAWVAGQALNSPGHYPLIFENAVDATWPPKWEPKSAGQPVKGRTWRGNKVIVGFSDNRVEIVKLEPLSKDSRTGDPMTLPKEILKPRQKEPVPILKILDIETGGGAVYLPGPPDHLGDDAALTPLKSAPSPPNAPPATGHPPGG